MTRPRLGLNALFVVSARCSQAFKRYERLDDAHEMVHINFGMKNRQHDDAQNQQHCGEIAVLVLLGGALVELGVVCHLMVSLDVGVWPTSENGQNPTFV